MLTPLSDGRFTYFPKPELNEAPVTIDRCPVTAGYLVGGDITTSNMDAVRYNWLAQEGADLESPDFLFKIEDNTGFQ